LVAYQFAKEQHGLADFRALNKFQYGPVSQQNEFLSKYGRNIIGAGNTIETTDCKQFAVRFALNGKYVRDSRHRGCRR
jgi:hypothetical protein